MVSNDLVVRFENRFLQLQPKRNQGVGAGARVLVQQRRDGALRVVGDDREIAFVEIAPPPPQVRPQAAVERRPAQPQKPAANHPWRRGLSATKLAVNSGRLWK